MILFRKAQVATLCVLSLVTASAIAADEAKSDSKSGSDVAATIGGAPVSVQDVDAKVMKTNSKMAQDLYAARVKALDEVLIDKALSEDAKAKGVSVDQLIKEQLAAKAKPVTDADVEKWYNENKTRFPNKTLEQVTGDIRSYLVQLNENDAKKELIKELKAKHNFKVILEPPRIKIDVAANEPAKGPASAKVTIVEYSDFQCPYCSKGAKTVGDLASEYKDKVRIVFRHNALAMHNRAAPAAEAAMCAHDQGKFWEFHDKFFNEKKLNDEDFKQIATDLGLDTEKFNACYSGGTHKALVQQQTNSTKDVGVSGAPAFFINGRMLSGAQPIENFKAIIDEELERAK